MTYINNKFASLEYRRAATQQASVVGLVVALHDTLMGDLRRAAEAMERNNIQERCNQLIHGFKVLQQLDAMLDMENGGDTAINVRRFYKHVRGQMLNAQFKLAPEVLKDQIRIIFEVRQAWQQIDGSPTEAYNEKKPTFPQASLQAREPDTQVQTHHSFSCSG